MFEPRRERKTSFFFADGGAEGRAASPAAQALNGHPQRPLQQQRAPYNKPVAEPFKPPIPTVRTTWPALLTRQPQRGAPMGDVEDEPADPAVTRAATDVRQYFRDFEYGLPTALEQALQADAGRDADIELLKAFKAAAEGTGRESWSPEIRQLFSVVAPIA